MGVGACAWALFEEGGLALLGLSSLRKGCLPARVVAGCAHLSLHVLVCMLMLVTAVPLQGSQGAGYG